MAKPAQTYIRPDGTVDTDRALTHARALHSQAVGTAIRKNSAIILAFLKENLRRAPNGSQVNS